MKSRKPNPGRSGKSPGGNEPAVVPLPSIAEILALGKHRREACPRDAHAIWKPDDRRPDPLRLLKASNVGRLRQLIPIRFGRMLRSPFTFYRGTALNMAADLALTASSGLRVQACGDAHLCNFGAFATPERRVIFDINDLDETLPAPWEWDVKRLAASVVVACRHNGISDDRARDAVLACVRTYRQRMAEYSRMRALDVWYARIDMDKLVATFKCEPARRRARKRLAAALQRCVVEHDFPKLVTMEGGLPAIKDNPPLIFHPQKEQGMGMFPRARAALADYRASVQEDRRTLIDQYQLMDIAIKVVGVGSVGTYCAVTLLMASDKDPLFLQVKEARASVLEPYAGKSIYANHGQRVVNGHRLMQSASDIFLGWTKGALGRHFYVRQLRDVKFAFQVELFSPMMMTQYAETCGWALARAHARSGPRALISGYLGKGDEFDQAITKFSVAYADQSESDYELLRKAARAGRVRVDMEAE